MSGGFPYEFPAELPGGDAPGAALDGANDTGGDGDGSLRPMLSHCESAFARLLAQYEESPLLKAFLCSYLHPNQDNDDAILTIYRALDVDTATGYMLDVLGRIVGERRGDRGTTTFRNAIKTRILINKSQGRIPDLIAIARLFNSIADEAGSYIRIGELQPMRIEVRIDRTPINPPHESDSRLRRAKAGGVGLQTILLTGDRTRAFRLSRAADYPASNYLEGLSRASDLTWGGRLAHVLS